MGGWEASTLHRDFEGREPQSWQESLAFYKHSQINRPFADEAYAKPPRVTRYEMSRREAEYNPITQAWRDEGRERVARERDAAHTLRTRNLAKDRQLAFERSSHDVINHTLRRTGLPDAQSEAGLTFPTQKREQRLAHGMDSTAPFNIISGLSVEEHHWAPPQHRPRIAPPREDTKLRSITQQPREYDMLSNEYKREHERRTAEEHERARRVAAERFWATHDYDVVTSKFYDPDKEARAQQLTRAIEVRGSAAQCETLGARRTCATLAPRPQGVARAAAASPGPIPCASQAHRTFSSNPPPPPPHPGCRLPLARRRSSHLGNLTSCRHRTSRARATSTRSPISL